MKSRYLALALSSAIACAWEDAAQPLPLHEAAEAGQAEECRRLLAAGADADARNEEGETPLITWIFVAENKAEVPDELIRASDLSARDSGGCSALYHAADAEQTALCRRLLAAGADANAADAAGNTPLHVAAAHGNEELCRLLLEFGARADAPNAEGHTPAQLAQATAKPELQQLMPAQTQAEGLSQPAQPNPQLRAAVQAFFEADADGAFEPLSADSDGVEARYAADVIDHGELCARGVESAADFPYLLCLSVVSHHQKRFLPQEKLEALLAAGADVNACDEAGATVFHWAVATAQGGFCEWLISHGARTDDWSPLHLAALLGYADECRRLVQDGADANAKNEADWTPLMYAARMGRAEACLALLAAGAEVSLSRADGLSPLFVAVEQGHAEVCRCLLEAGADANALLDQDMPPLYLAVARDQEDVCRELLAAGADPNKIRLGNESESALSWAVVRENAALCRLLLAAGADPNATDVEGSTPLHRAAMLHNEELYLLLLQAGADPDKKNEYGMSAKELK